MNEDELPILWICPQKGEKQRTVLGYLRYCCTACRRKFNERTGTAFNYLEYPTDIVMMVVIYRLRYKLSVRDMAEMFLLRGFQFTYEAVREGESRFAPLITEHLRDKRKGKAGRSWHVDETYLKINGQRAMALFVSMYRSRR